MCKICNEWKKGEYYEITSSIDGPLSINLGIMMYPDKHPELQASIEADTINLGFEEIMGVSVPFDYCPFCGRKLYSVSSESIRDKVIKEMMEETKYNNFRKACEDINKKDDEFIKMVKSVCAALVSEEFDDKK